MPNDLDVEGRPPVLQWKAVMVRWVVFSFLFVVSMLLPAIIPGLAQSDGPLAGLWLLWVLSALVPEGFTDRSNVLYLQDTAQQLAIAFWAVTGLIYAWATRRARLGYVVLGAYPTMILALLVVTAGLAALGYYHYSSL